MIASSCHKRTLIRDLKEEDNDLTDDIIKFLNMKSST
jgi:hypothetical protein